MKNLFCIGLIMMFLASRSAIAGDAHQFLDLGFSPTGEEYGFVTYGTRDGSGEPFASAYILNASTDQILTRASVSLPENQGSEAEAISAALAGLQTTGYFDRETPITDTIGQTVFIAPALDLNGNVQPITSATFVMTSPTSRAELQLTESAVGTFEDQVIKAFRLILIRNGRPIVVLHEDIGRIPRSRGPAYVYSIHRIITYQNRIAVVISYKTIGGFEGPDSKFLVVTGQI